MHIFIFKIVLYKKWSYRSHFFQFCWRENILLQTWLQIKENNCPFYPLQFHFLQIFITQICFTISKRFFFYKILYFLRVAGPDAITKEVPLQTPTVTMITHILTRKPMQHHEDSHRSQYLYFATLGLVVLATFYVYHIRKNKVNSETTVINTTDCIMTWNPLP